MNQSVSLLRVGAVSFDPVSATEACEAIIEAATASQPIHVHLSNAYTVALADKDPQYRRVLSEGTNFADGKPISWISRLLHGRRRISQVRGPQLFLDVFSRGRASGIRHYLLGSSPETLAKLEHALHERFPGIEIVGSFSPPFRQLSELELAEQDVSIRQSGAQIVWVGLGTPKQDFECRRLAGSVRIPAVAVGAAFDFAAGTQAMAPAWMTSIGLEWVHRLLSEPRRLWKRYLFGNARFIWSAIRFSKTARDEMRVNAVQLEMGRKS